MWHECLLFLFFLSLTLMLVKFCLINYISYNKLIFCHSRFVLFLDFMTYCTFVFVIGFFPACFSGYFYDSLCQNVVLVSHV